MNATKTHSFFDALFELPEHRWRGYLDDNLPPREVAATMLNLFNKLEFDLKSELVRSALSPSQAARILRAAADSI